MKLKRFELQLFGINTYILWDEKALQAAIVDPGMSSSREENLVASFIEKNQLEVKSVIYTHLHVDHIAGNAFVVEKYHPRVLANKQDEFLGKRSKEQAMMFQLPIAVSDIDITDYLEDGGNVKLGEELLNIIHVPGHSPGSVAIYHEKDGVLLSGDALFAGSIGRTDLPGGDYGELINSLKTKLLLLPPKTIVYPGHGDSTTIADEAAYNPFLR